MKNKKVYCKDCRYCYKDYGGLTLGDSYVCSHPNNTRSTAYSPYYPKIEEINKNNACKNYECFQDHIADINKMIGGK